MAYLGDGQYQAFGHHELMMLRGDGTYDIWCYGYQPTTDDIAARTVTVSPNKYTLCIQKIGDAYEVYDLRTLKQQITGWTIGLPIATHADVDAAIMAATLLA